MDVCKERNKQSKHDESDRKRQKLDLRFDDGTFNKETKLNGKKFKVSTNTWRFYRILCFAALQPTKTCNHLNH